MIVKGHVRKSRKTNAEKYKDIPTGVVEVFLPGLEQSCPDCGTLLVHVGKEYVQEELVYIPATLKLVRYYRTTINVRPVQKDIIWTRTAINL